MNKKGGITWLKFIGATSGMLGFLLLGLGNNVWGEILIGIGGALIAVGS